MNNAYDFSQLKTADLFIDALYRGGTQGNAGDDPLNQLLGVANMGGFRAKLTEDKSDYAFVALYSSKVDPDWPDSIDLLTGTLTYYGDNKKPGRSLEDTSLGGNRILSKVFEYAHQGKEGRMRVPPFLIFTKADQGRDVIFRGLAVPGSHTTSQIDDLVAVWKIKDGERFQNYRAIFTLLDEPVIKQDWLQDCAQGNHVSNNTPNGWMDWIEHGKYDALIAEPTVEYRDKIQQLPESRDGQLLLKTIYDYFEDNPYAFERFAADIVRKMDQNIETIDLTRAHMDGGRDALGKYRLGIESDPVLVDFAMEAKCYAISNSVGVRETSRLISRLRHRQFGILVSTSYVARQAYKEMREDKQPIIIVSGRDIVDILRRTGLGNIEDLQPYLQQFPV